MSKNKEAKFEELEIESIAFQGKAVAKKDGVVYFVENAVPGDTVKAQIKRKKKRYYECFTSEIIKASEFRVEPQCKHFGLCGGCSWQNLQYQNQLYWKKQHVIDALQRIGKLEVGEFFDTLESPSVFSYRNKMEFSFGCERWMTADELTQEGEILNKHFALGLHIPKRFDKILNIDYCYLQDEKSNEVLNAIRAKALELGLTAYDLIKHEGFLRSLLIRKSFSENQLMIILISTDVKNEEEQLFINWFYNDFPKILNDNDNLLHCINNSFSPVAVGTVEKLVRGNEFLTEDILGIKYRISPFSFFQTNSLQLNRFISKIIEFADIKSWEVIWDLYCGTGSITLPASKQAMEIYGIELVESSVADAKANAEINNIDNTKFYCADLHAKEIPDLLNSLPQPDTVIIDPPRAGMHQNLVNHLLKIKPKKIVYVSCNPTTQARDCELLKDLYKITKVQPVDLFPHTFHIESIAQLVRKEL